MRRTLERENFTSARRRRAISLSMLKVPIQCYDDEIHDLSYGARGRLLSTKEA